MIPSSSNVTWSSLCENWELVCIPWSCIQEIGNLGGKPGDFYGEWNLREEEFRKKKGITKENYIKVFLTVHNQFLTEDQKRIIKIAQAYPTYEEKHMIEEQVKVALNEIKLNNKPYPKAKVEDIKIGIEKIIEHVKNNSKK